MVADHDMSHGKTAGELAREALQFFANTIYALLILVAIMTAFYVIAHPDQNDNNPKLLCTILAFWDRWRVDF